MTVGLGKDVEGSAVIAPIISRAPAAVAAAFSVSTQRMSPLTTSGIEIASLTARIASQLAVPL